MVYRFSSKVLWNRQGYFQLLWNAIPSGPSTDDLTEIRGYKFSDICHQPLWKQPPSSWNLQCQPEEGHLQPEHIHILLSIQPKYPAAQVIDFIKGKSAIHIARILGPKKNYTGMHFWARGYCIILTLFLALSSTVPTTCCKWHLSVWTSSTRTDQNQWIHLPSVRLEPVEGWTEGFSTAY